MAKGDKHFIITANNERTCAEFNVKMEIWSFPSLANTKYLELHEMSVSSEVHERIWSLANKLAKEHMSPDMEVKYSTITEI